MTATRGGISVSIVGGGPAGLLAARLLARAGFDVELTERLEAGVTYGFGVALAPPALARLEEHDHGAAERVREICHPIERWTMRRGAEVLSVGGQEAYGVSRAKLLETLHSLATEAGARVRHGVFATPDDLRDADIVVFADGVGSQGRHVLADRFGAQVSTVPFAYIWCGAHRDLDTMLLDLRQTDYGIFSGHVMPYSDSECTFQIDTVPDTLAAAGLLEEDSMPATTDDRSLKLLEDVFASTLADGQLLGNASRWSRFRSVKCERWSHDKFVLLGDAAHTAHYTVGSGTRMAMEDAIALGEALQGEEHLAAAFDAYEGDRRPAVEHLQYRAERSLTWWRTIESRIGIPLPALLFSYFTRTGVGMVKLCQSDPAIVEAAIAARANRIAGSSAARSDQLHLRSLPRSDELRAVIDAQILDGSAADHTLVDIACDDLTPWSKQTAALAESLQGPLSAPGRAFVLRGRPDTRSVLTRFDIAEELKGHTTVPVAVAASADTPDEIATGLVADRAEFVVIED